jgi:hypothetical protein
VRAIHLAHSAGTDQASNLVRAEPRADRNGQWRGGDYTVRTVDVGIANA